jgi:hypothetical protein
MAMIEHKFPDKARKGLRRWRLRESAQFRTLGALSFAIPVLLQKH